MKYYQTEVRRQNRLLSESDAITLLREGEYGFLSLIDEGGKPYGIPISYVWNGNDNIYLHGAPEGKKLKCITKQPNVSFSIVGRTNVIPEKFTTSYSSVILACEATVVLNDEERMYALKLLISKYSPGLEEVGLKYAKGSFQRTAIIKMKVLSWSGKAKVI
ncbi:MAG: pyridoxamine 5'-phosphate oxidase family protein [Paludibacteraceae bacterium]|nr:pyridoxamine 5'-phosphate oxidase family protein [Paludibacteraceae bacterium]